MLSQIAGEALEEVPVIVNTCQSSEILLYAARLLEVVCRGSNLAPRQVEVAHNISLNLFEKISDHHEYKFHSIHVPPSSTFLIMDPWKWEKSS